MLITTALLASFALPSAPIEEPTLTWHQGTIETAIGEADERETLAAVYFWRNGSEYCTDFYQNTLGDGRVVEAIDDFVLFSAQHGTDAGNALFEKYNVKSLPTVLFIDGSGKLEDAVAGFAYADGFVAELDRIGRGELTMSDLERKIAASEKGSDEKLELRYKHAVKIGDLGDKDGGEAAFAAISDSDKRGKTVIGCKVKLQLAMTEISEAAGGEEKIAEWDIRPIYTLVKKVKNAEGKFEIWDQIANIEALREDMGLACKAWMNASELVPEERAMKWSRGIANYIMHVEGDRTSQEKKFVLSLATRASQLASLVEAEECKCEDDYKCEHEDSAMMQADFLATLARAYKLNGDAKMASLTAKQSVELNGSDENHEHLSELL